MTLRETYRMIENISGFVGVLCGAIGWSMYQTAKIGGDDTSRAFLLATIIVWMVTLAGLLFWLLRPLSEIFDTYDEGQESDMSAEMHGGEAALAIGEHTFRAGFKAGAVCLPGEDGLDAENLAWSEYDPPEEIKALS